MEDHFPTMSEVESSMRGGGYSITRHRTYVNRLIALFVERGWSRNKMVHMFRTLTDTHIGSHHLYGFAEEWMKYKASLVPATPPETLFAIGVRPQVIRLLNTRIFVPLAEKCYTYSQLVDIAIEYLLYNTPITAPDPQAHLTHPFQPENTRSWFFLTDEDDGSSRPPCFNLPFRCSRAKEARIHDLFVRQPLPTHNPETHDLHFHTTQWGSVPRILFELQHTAGRTCLDFGLYPGFYMSQTLKDALDWGYALSRMFGNEVAILVFSLPKTLPSPLRVKRLEGDEWIAVTQEARRCIPNPSHIRAQRVSEIATIRPYDFIYGNMVANTNDVKVRGAVPITHEPPKTQLTSKTRRGDLFLQEHIAGCLFFQKYIPTATNRTRRANRSSTNE